MRVWQTTAVLAAVFALFILPASANGQWLNYKTPGIPRTPDGKPDLAAPAPKMPDGKPDLSGIWQANSGGYTVNVASDLKPGEVRPWAEALYQQRKENLSKDNPGIRCLPGISAELSLGMYKILQTPGVIGLVGENGAFRQILRNPLGRAIRSDIGTGIRWWWRAPDSTTRPGWTLKATRTQWSCTSRSATAAWTSDTWN